MHQYQSDMVITLVKEYDLPPVRQPEFIQISKRLFNSWNKLHADYIITDMPGYTVCLTKDEKLMIFESKLGIFNFINANEV